MCALPPVEETVAAHLCPAAAKTLGSDISLPSKPCRTTAHLVNKAYASDGEAASALHAMAVLQVFQAKLLQAAEGGALTAEATKDLRAATDFALMATKRAAQAVGKAMGFMVVLQRHLWLNLADLKEADRKVLLNALVTPSGLFGDAVESITERFAEAQKRAKAMSHVMPRRTFQQQTARSRSSSAPGSAQRRDIPRPAPAVGTATAPRQEPDVRRKAWGPSRKRQGQRRSPRRDSRPPPTAGAVRPLQLWLKSRVPWTAWTSGRLSIAVTCGCIEALAPWHNPDLFSRGVPLGLVTSRMVV